MRPSVPRRIVFAVYDGVALLDLSGPLEVFRIATEAVVKQPPKAYECTVVSSRAGRVRTASGVDLYTKSFRSLAGKQIDTLLVPGAFSVEDVTRDRALLQWFRRTAPACRRVCSVCSGTFLLAAAGLLAGRRAATHWAQASRLTNEHPDVTVEPDAIYVHDHGIWSSGGGSSGIDLALALIEQDAGREVALQVADFRSSTSKGPVANLNTAPYSRHKRTRNQIASRDSRNGSWRISKTTLESRRWRDE